MANVKHASFAVFLLAAFVMFPTKTNGCGGQVTCGTFIGFDCGSGCKCVITDYVYGVYLGVCENDNGNFQSKVEEQPNLCWSHDECTKKGSGNFCARSPNSNLKYGWCFASVSEAQDAYKMVSTYKFKKDFLKMSVPA